MKARELRIGNFVGFAFDQLSIPAEVIVFTNHDCNVQFLYDPNIELLGNIQTDVEYKYIYPIPLTKEWLVKFGFFLNKYTEYYKNVNGQILGFTKEEENHNELMCYYGGEFIPIKYVHQLQNLYFALTGEELTIKEP